MGIKVAEVSRVNTFLKIRIIFVVTAMQRTKATRSITIVCNVFELAVIMTRQCILKLNFGWFESARILPLQTSFQKMGSISCSL